MRPNCFISDADVFTAVVTSLFISPTLVAAQWQPNGVPLCAAASDQEPRQLYISQSIASDGVGGAIVVWLDFRSGTGIDIYARRVSSSGALQWMADGVAVCTAETNQQLPAMVSDGAGGAIVAWTDGRNESGSDIYAQRINSSGVAVWTANGVALCAADSIQELPVIVSDGAGGATVTWSDRRSGEFDVYAQRIAL